MGALTLKKIELNWPTVTLWEVRILIWSRISTHFCQVSKKPTHPEQNVDKQNFYSNLK